MTRRVPEHVTVQGEIKTRCLPQPPNQFQERVGSDWRSSLAHENVPARLLLILQPAQQFQLPGTQRLHTVDLRGVDFGPRAALAASTPLKGMLKK